MDSKAAQAARDRSRTSGATTHGQDRPSRALRLGLPLPREPEETRIAQLFGENAETYARFGLSGHNGVDFEAYEGEPVLAVDDGEVLEVRFDPLGYGLTVKLSHPWGESRYGHGLRYSAAAGLELGSLVRRGERIFLAGAAHVHLGIRLRGEDGSLDHGNGFRGYDDPLPYLPLTGGLSARFVDGSAAVRREPADGSGRRASVTRAQPAGR